MCRRVAEQEGTSCISPGSEVNNNFHFLPPGPWARSTNNLNATHSVPGSRYLGWDAGCLEEAGCASSSILMPCAPRVYDLLLYRLYLPVIRFFLSSASNSNSKFVRHILPAIFIETWENDRTIVDHIITIHKLSPLTSQKYSREYCEFMIKSIFINQFLRSSQLLSVRINWEIVWLRTLR